MGVSSNYGLVSYIDRHDGGGTIDTAKLNRRLSLALFAVAKDYLRREIRKRLVGFIFKFREYLPCVMHLFSFPGFF